MTLHPDDITLTTAPEIDRTIEGSSTIARVQWWPERRDGNSIDLLRITFHSGGSYDFAGVARGMVDTFLAAPSLGKFFAARIKGKYPSTKVTT